MPLLKKVNTPVKISGPGAGGVNLFNISAIMREELHRLAGEHKQAVKKGGSVKLTSRLLQKIERVTYCLQAMGWDLDD
ncbi:MAG: hypothetical protein HOP31_00515 [Ignavibacteria bacterium]|nr:hypothetical protein [Ignavibacteria bacterium]